MNTNNDEFNIKIDPADFSKLANTYKPNKDANIRDLIPDSDPLLYEESLPWGEGITSGLKQLILDLTETMRYHGGIGISAVQCGIPIKLFLVEMGDDQPKVFINAKIVDTTDGTCVMDEGCLSYPGISVKVTRPKAVRVRYMDETGNTETEKFFGLTARIVQHELAHTMGETIKSVSSRLRWEQALNRKKKSKR